MSHIRVQERAGPPGVDEHGRRVPASGGQAHRHDAAQQTTAYEEHGLITLSEGATSDGTR